jgi:hypothetical protein
MQSSRDLTAVLTQTSATLSFANPPAHKGYNPGVEKQNLKAVQASTHDKIPAQNFIRPLIDREGTDPAIRQSGYTVYSSAFSSMAHYAFAQHHAMVIRPDDIHLLILQGISRFIQIYSEDFRPSLASFTGKKELEIRNDELTETDPLIWTLLPEGFASLIREDVPGEVVDVLLQDYSETTQIEREVKAVTLMGTFSAYFQYAASTLCFIPEFVLKGTEKDWELLAQIPQKLIQLLNLRECAGNEKENGTHLLCRWLTRLAPIVEQMYQSRCGNPDSAFWHSFYKFQESSGSDYVTGNIVYFYPFLQKSVHFRIYPGEFVLNEYIMQREGITLAKQDKTGGFHSGPEYAGPTTNLLPANVVDVNFQWKKSGQAYNMAMKAGIFAFNVTPKPKESVSTFTDYTIFFRDRQPAKPSLQQETRVVDLTANKKRNQPVVFPDAVMKSSVTVKEASREEMDRKREQKLALLREYMNNEAALEANSLFALQYQLPSMQQDNDSKKTYRF